MGTLTISTNYLESIRENVSDTVKFQYQDFRVMCNKTQAKAQNALEYAKEVVRESKGELYERATAVLTSPSFKEATSGVHAVRMAILIMTFGIVDVLSLPIFLARLTSGIAHILNFQESLAKTGFTQQESFVVSRRLTERQNNIATGVTIIARGVLEVSFIPAAFAFAVYDGMQRGA